MVAAGLADLFEQLNAASETQRQKERNIRERSPSIPRSTDAFLASKPWQPPMLNDARAEAKAMFEAGHRARPTFCSTARGLGEFSAREIMKPKVLSPRTAARVVQPDRTFNVGVPKGFKAYAGGVSRDVPPTHDDMCSEQHRKWLDQHYKQREKHLYPAHDALTRVEALEKTVKDHRLHCNTAAAEKAQKQLAKAKSDPVLVLRPDTPEYKTKHLRRWAGPEHAGGNFQKSAMDMQEDRELTLRKRQQRATQGGWRPSLPARNVGGAASSPALSPSSAAQSRPSVSMAASAFPGTSPARPTTGRPATGANMGTSGFGWRPQTGGRGKLAGVGNAVVAK